MTKLPKNTVNHEDQDFNLETKFVDRSLCSRAYLKVVGVLKRLAESEGLDVAQRAVGEALSEQIRQNFIEIGKVKESRTRYPHWQKLKGRKSYDRKSIGYPLDDHETLWNRDGEPWTYVSQPYYLTEKELRKIVDRCDKENLNAVIRADKSWHFPGRTFLVCYFPSDS